MAESAVYKFLRLMQDGVKRKIEWALMSDLPISDAQALAFAGQNQQINALSLAVGGKLGMPGAPVARTLALATLYQAIDPTKPAIVSLGVETNYTVTLASVLEDIVELRIGAPGDKDKLLNGSGGVAVASFRSSLKGLAVTIGMVQAQRSQLLAVLPTGWYFAVRRTVGTTATIQGAIEQPFG